MAHEEIMDWIIKARADVLHASRLLVHWDPGVRRRPGANEYALLVDLIRQANDALDRVVSGIVKESTIEMEESAPRRPIRRSAANRPRAS